MMNTLFCRSIRNPVLGVLLILASLLQACTPAIIAIAGAIPTGSATFFDAGRVGSINAITITAQNLPPQAAGKIYEGWLVDQEQDIWKPLGPFTFENTNGEHTWMLQVLRVKPGQNLLYTVEGDNLQLWVTTESAAGLKDVPSASPLLIGQYPIKPFMHIQHLFSSFA